MLINDIIMVLQNYICINCNNYTENLLENTNFCIKCNLIYIKGHNIYNLLEEELYETDT